MTLQGEPSGLVDWPTAGGTFSIRWEMRTDVGHRREVNEDSAVVAPPVFAVADGMGGHEAGEVASAYVVERLATLAGQQVDGSRIADALRQAVNDLVASGVDVNSGTTVTGLYLPSDAAVPSVHTFNIGDSRVYVLHKGMLSQVTKDHSVVQELVDSGQLSPEEAEVHPHSNVITRAVGFHDDPVPDVVPIMIESGDRVLICSDGLTKELTDFGLTQFLADSQPLDAAADALLNLALENGGRDNITVIVLDFTFSTV